MGRRTGASLAGLAAVALTLTAAGCGGSKGTDTVVIGFQGPLSGQNSQLGINALDGVKTAVSMANSKGNLPFTLRIEEADDQGTPDVGPTAAQQLIDDSDVLAVVGPVFSGPTKSSEPLYSRAGLLSVSPSATNPALTTLGFRTFYRVIAPDTVQGAGAATFMAKTLRAKKVFSLDDRTEYGVGLSTVLEKQLRTDGVPVVHDSIIPTKDYSAEATKIISQSPDAVYYSGYYSEFALLSKALRGKGYQGTLLSGDGSNDDQYISQAGRANAEGTYLTCACGDANANPNAAGFVAEFKRVNDKTRPGTYSGESFDATNAVISVLEQLGKNPTRADVAKAFGSVNLQGITKKIAFQPDGDVADSTVYVYRVENGQRVVLGTTNSLARP
jgi:branched-chain amino acid transport system substrate-binding protein